jgi:hypothetical protein
MALFIRLALTAVLTLAGASVVAQANAPKGEITGDAWVHTKESLAATVQQAPHAC